MLEGIDGSTSYFHIKTDEGADIKGELADSFPRGEQWTTNVAYRAKVKKLVRVRYSTGEEKPRWLLLSLEGVSHRPTLALRRSVILKVRAVKGNKLALSA
jgi:hypothetical protein